jgi:hypothetical protein
MGGGEGGYEVVDRNAHSGMDGAGRERQDKEEAIYIAPPLMENANTWELRLHLLLPYSSMSMPRPISDRSRKITMQIHRFPVRPRYSLEVHPGEHVSLCNLWGTGCGYMGLIGTLSHPQICKHSLTVITLQEPFRVPSVWTKTWLRACVETTQYDACRVDVVLRKTYV